LKHIPEKLEIYNNYGKFSNIKDCPYISALFEIYYFLGCNNIKLLDVVTINVNNIKLKCVFFSEGDDKAMCKRIVTLDDFNFYYKGGVQYAKYVGCQEGQEYYEIMPSIARADYYFSK
jgi:hypothetical protein